MKDVKDWSAAITGIADLDNDATLSLYSEILATAHDIGYKVPDQQLIETEDATKLRAVMPALHEGLIKFHAAAKADAARKAAEAAKAPKPVKKTAAKKAVTTAPTKPVKKTAQKGASTTEKTAMATEKAVKAPAKKAVAKKAAKAPAKKAVAKKGAKKAATANARTPVVKNQFGEKAVIKVLTKENPARADTERGKRIAVVYKYHGKKVADFYANEKPPYNRTDTLRYLIDNEHISIK